MSRPLRIAVLECDTPIQPVVDKFGNYGEIFERLLTNAAGSSVNMEISKWNVVGNPIYPNPNEVDAFLLSGSSMLLSSLSPTWSVLLIHSRT